MLYTDAHLCVADIITEITIDPFYAMADIEVVIYVTFIFFFFFQKENVTVVKVVCSESR